MTDPTGTPRHPPGLVDDVDTGPRRVSCRVEVDATAGEVFALVSDPHRHPELDGSGTVRDREVKGPHQLTEGARFGVGMRQYGVPYAITSTVTEVVPDRVVEWRHPMGHTWRWELEELTPGRTRVTETFDYTGAKVPKMLEVLGIPEKNRVGITRTLEALSRRFA